METSLYRLELTYPPRSDLATKAWGYVARANEHAGRPDKLLHLEDGGMPVWGKDGAYWTSADAFSRKDGRRYFAILITLPRQLTLPQQIELAQKFAAQVSSMAEDRYTRLPYTFGVHAGYGRNPHLHLLFSPCMNDKIGREPQQWFGRFNPARPADGGTRKDRGLTQKRFLLTLRETWERTANALLSRWNYPTYIDRRSYRDQGLDIIAGLHLGPAPQPGRPNPGRELRKKRNEEIADEAARQLRAEAERRERAVTHARAAIERLDEIWANLHIPNVSAASIGSSRFLLDATPLLRTWSESTNPGVCIHANHLIERWSRWLDMVRESAYQFSARRQLGADWDCTLCGAYLVWTHPVAGALLDAGGVVLAQDTSVAQAEAVATLLWSRGAEYSEVRGHGNWRELVASALGQRGIAIGTPPQAPTLQPSSQKLGQSGVRP